MSNTLAGKIALITGAASGMGLETTKRFVEEGARVLAIDVLGDELCQLDEFTGVFALTADVTNEDDIEKIFAELQGRFGRLDALCNFAGINDLAYPLLETDDTHWDLVLDTDLKAPFRICRKAVPLMRDSGGGSIVNIGSYAALRGNHGPSYTAAKAGLVGLTKSIAFRHASDGIRCNIVNPGGMRTGIITHSMEQLQKTYHAAGGDLSKIVAAMPVNTYLEPVETANICVFLCSDAAKGINGAMIAVDGGMAVC